VVKIELQKCGVIILANYITVEDGGFEKLFHDRMNEENPNLSRCAYVITVQELIDCVHKQKVGKATGPDDIAMEAIINGVLSWQFIYVYW